MKKRKPGSSSLGSRKKLKIRHDNADSLPWKAVSRPTEASMGFEDGILELEEVDNVEVIYEETEGGKITRFNVCVVMFVSSVPAQKKLGASRRRRQCKQFECRTRS
jgi:hypothetical protein